jgi:hypothetical protein
LLFFALILGDNSGSYLRTEKTSATISAIKVVEREGYSRFSGHHIHKLNYPFRR